MNRGRGGMSSYASKSGMGGGMGQFNDFNAVGGGDQGQGAYGGGAERFSARGSGGMGGGDAGVAQQLMYMQQDYAAMRDAVIQLESDRDNLRQAIRKLKVENSRMKLKMKQLATAMKASGATFDVDMENEGPDMMDFDDIKEYLLVGGPLDPFSLRHEVVIKDRTNQEHKSAERYFWYKMAETFGDMEAAEKIRTAGTTVAAEEAMKAIKGYEDNTWNQVKMRYWEEGQRMKFEQVRWAQNLLVYSKDIYLAVASQDKKFGTGWRKNRVESGQPKMWDGENLGGKVLMKLRDNFKQAHAWMGPNEETETEKKYTELKRSVWRRVRPEDRQGGMGRGGMGMMGRIRGSRGRGGMRGRGGRGY